MFTHKKEAHKPEKTAKCTKCEIKTKDKTSWLTFHECPHTEEEYHTPIPPHKEIKNETDTRIDQMEKKLDLLIQMNGPVVNAEIV